MEKQKELWKQIEGVDGYEISNLGRVKSHARFKRGGKSKTKFIPYEQRILNPSMDAAGYLHVRLRKVDGTYQLFKVHRLVAKYFLSDYSEDLSVDHINMNKADNSVYNLRMLSFFQNFLAFKKTVGSHKYLVEQTGQIITSLRCFFKRLKMGFNKYEFKRGLINGNGQCRYNGYTFKQVR